ncbi:hypothetical protein [Paenibacillus sp. 1P07SE]|uniref:hypothetical protein n=1 Tax=Paenibacillus sp. 1P07SE TaxID=3132209 RepID=UPI0039A56565
MLIVLFFAALTLLIDLPEVRKVQQRKAGWFAAVAAGLLIWNCLAVELPWWPNPNDILLAMFGWVDRLLKGG